MLPMCSLYAPDPLFGLVDRTERERPSDCEVYRRGAEGGLLE